MPKPKPSDWRVAKSIFVADDDKVAQRYGRSAEGPYHFYFKQLIRKLVGAGGRGNLFKLDQNQPDSEITADYVTKKLVIAGTVNSVVDQILAFREKTGRLRHAAVSLPRLARPGAREALDAAHGRAGHAEGQRRVEIRLTLHRSSMRYHFPALFPSGVLMRSMALSLVLFALSGSAALAQSSPGRLTGQVLYLPIYSHVRHDDTGGSGANFVISWKSDAPDARRMSVPRLWTHKPAGCKLSTQFSAAHIFLRSRSKLSLVNSRSTIRVTVIRLSSEA